MESNIRAMYRNLCRVLIVIVGIAVIPLASPAIYAQAESDPEQTLAHLRQLWRSQHDLLASAQFTGVAYRGGRADLKITPEAVFAKYQPLKFPAAEKELMQLRESFCRTDAGFQPVWGNRFEIHFYNGKLRERWLNDAGDDYHWDRLYDGQRSSDYRASNRQYDVFDGRSFVGYLSPERLRTLPVDLEGPVEGFKQEPGSVTLKSRIWEIQADPLNGFVSKFCLFYPNGELNFVIYGLDPMTSDDGQIFPSRRLTLNYDMEGSLFGIDLMCITEFRSNPVCDEQLFQMNTVAGAKLVDYREPMGDRYRVIGTGSGGQDVFFLADQRVSDQGIPQKAHRVYVEFLVIGALILFVAWMVWRKQNLSQQPNKS